MSRRRDEAIVEARIESIALDGDGVARTPEGALFVPQTAPGELVRVRVTTAGRGRRRTGTLLEVLERSPERVEPRCEVFGRCGGCQLQHLSEPAQRAAKQALLSHALGRPVGPIVSAPSAWGWRVRVRLHADRGVAGLHGAGTHAIVPLGACPILAPGSEAALREIVPTVARAVGGAAEILVDQARDGRTVLLVRASAPLGAPAYAALEALVTAGAVVGIALEVPGVRGLARLGDPDPWGRAADGTPLRLAPGSFAQSNPAVTEQLGRALIEGLAPRADDRVLELFAGVGTFTVALAPHVGEIVAVESMAESVRALEDNARARGLDHVRPIAGDAETHAARARGRFSLVVLDPPRTGVSEALCAAIAARRPRRIGYVSCDPRSLGRDLRRFEQHGWTARTLTGFDMFPQTAHVECLAILAPADR